MPESYPQLAPLHQHGRGRGVGDEGAYAGRDDAEGDDYAVGRAPHPGQREHEEREPPVEAVGDHGLGQNEGLNKQENDGVGEAGEDDIAGASSAFGPTPGTLKITQRASARTA